LAHREVLVARLCELTKRMKSADLLAKLEAVGVPAGPINDLDQVFSDPQVMHRGMRLELASAAAKGGKIPGVRTPIMIGGEPMAAERPSPRLGEHTTEILSEIGEARALRWRGRSRPDANNAHVHRSNGALSSRPKAKGCMAVTLAIRYRLARGRGTE